MMRNWQTEDGQHAVEHKNFTKNVEKWIAQGYTNPDLCFVWVEDSAIKGGIVYALDNPEAASILDFSISQDSFHLGKDLLNQSQEKLSVHTVCYHLYNDSEQYDDYRKCFLKAGFSVAQEKLSYRFADKPLESKPIKVEFQSFRDTGEREFVDAVALVTSQTLDTVDANAVTKHGQMKAAEMLVKELQEIDFQPDIWMLAYAGDTLIGLVIPSNLGDSYGGINYIGVVPTERGKGYVDDLLYKGTQLLLNQGITTVIADIDVLNFPMKGALERVGYNFSQEEVVLEKML
jgi:RimJ/RimL family protein N-acetyltransferase